ncbi:MAG: COX15/CtaA family protein, partial [Planctomycetes bacterium]|nr:COX15/CtaA family protein [Planctomycetota bacterium]
MSNSSSVGPASFTAAASPLAPHASVASWLSVLFVLLMLLATVGGYVRLSGSGLSIPDWPVIKVGDSWSLLPPTDEAGWASVKQRYDVDQAELALKERRGAIGMGSLGAYPRDMAGFKRMFLIEWGHRFAAALVAIVAAGCLTVVLRKPGLRQRIGPVFAAACGLIVVQALVGGMLVKSGTATHWLFVHLGIAAIIIALIVWSILRLVHDPAQRPDAATLAARRPLARAA